MVRAEQHVDSPTFQLSPPILHDVGLAAASEWLAEEMERSYGLIVSVKRSEEPPLDEEVKISVFRALRELLINVSRHADTDEARVSLVREDDTLVATVQDGGTGFDLGETEGGFGLLSVRERLEAFGGRFEIESGPGQGTRARLMVPLAVDGEPGDASG